MARFGFLFNHDQTHQIAHSLPIALELARLRPDADIVIATTNPRIGAAVRAMLPADLPSNIRHIELNLGGVSRWTERMAGRLIPVRKLLIYRDNLDFFRSLDVLVVAEKTSLVLKNRYGLDRLKIVHTRHGAGDRAIGFDAASREFDHVLCSGPKIRDRLIRESGVAPDRISIVGYPKFDACAVPHSQAKLPFDTLGRKVVLYNPHPSPRLSSWFRHGRGVLDHFLASDEYFLIFAPHVMLFERKLVVSIAPLAIATPGTIDRKYHECPHIHIDLGGPACVNMTYTNGADLYLGDVSSQIYEFLYTPRPCLFLNSHNVEWEGDANYAHWRAGPVIAGPDQLAAGFGNAFGEQERLYRPIQQEMFAQSFSLTERPSAVRAAEVVAKLS